MENDRAITAPDAAIRHHCDRPSPYCSGYKILQHNLILTSFMLRIRYLTEVSKADRDHVFTDL